MSIQQNNNREFHKYLTYGAYHWAALQPKFDGPYALTKATYEILLRLGRPWIKKRVLDLGCGDGALTWLLYQEGAIVVGLDLDHTAVVLACQEFFRRHSTSAPFLVGEDIHLPFPDQAFDTVVMCEVIEHVYQPEATLAEVDRVLTPGGMLILSTPCKLLEILPPEHYQEFFQGELASLLRLYFAEVVIEPFAPAWILELYSPLKPGRFRLVKYIVNGLTILGCNPFLSQPSNNRYFFRQAARCVFPLSSEQQPEKSCSKVTVDHYF